MCDSNKKNSRVKRIGWLDHSEVMHFDQSTAWTAFKRCALQEVTEWFEKVTQRISKCQSFLYTSKLQTSALFDRKWRIDDDSSSLNRINGFLWNWKSYFREKFVTLLPVKYHRISAISRWELRITFWQKDNNFIAFKMLYQSLLKCCFCGRYKIAFWLGTL